MHKHRRVPTYEEKGNLFTVVIAPSGAGKTLSCHSGCIDPIMEHLDLQDASLGEITVGNKLKICYATVPSDDLLPEPPKYNVSVEEATFPKEDEKLTIDNINTISENHPFQEQLDGFLERIQLPKVR